MLKYAQTGSTDAAYNLSFEEYILTHKRQGDWLLLWQNSPTVVVGLNQVAEAEADLAYCAAHGVAVVRRATGGGAVYHDLGNLNYSLISDAGEEASLSLARFMRPVCEALRSMGVPAEATGRNDITIEGLKVSGTAQRLYSGRVLHHGTLLFKTDREAMAAALRPAPDKFSGKAAKSVRSRVGEISGFLPRGTTLEGFRSALLAALAPEGLAREELTAGELAEVERLAREKYRSPSWTFGRAPDFGFKSSRRFPGGSISVSLDVSGGRIRGAAVSGDFMASVPPDELIEALKDVEFSRESVYNAVKSTNFPAILGGITPEEFTDTVFDRD